jgi:hypothetical protein
MTIQSEQSRLLAVLRRIAATFSELDVSWALVGGLAVSVRAEPRFTRDIDLAVLVADDAAADRLVRELSARGFRLILSLEHAVLQRLATVRLLAPGEPHEGIVVDLLFASSGIEDEICRDADRLDVVPGLDLPVAQAGHLVAAKILASSPDRPQDAVDLQVLIRDLSDIERRRALEALARIEARGAHRGKALRDEARRWLGAPEN